MTSPTFLSTSPVSPLPHTSPELESHFVQALHDFFPANAPADNNSACLFFQRGAIIEVYNRDESGWWDGVTDGLRGWFPSNHVGHLGQLRRHSLNYNDLQDTSQMKEFEAWRHGSISTANNVIDPHSSDTSVLPIATAQYNLNDNASMSCRSYSESSNASIHHSYDGSHMENVDPYHYQYTPDRVELARTLLNEDRQKFGVATPESLPNKKNSTFNLDYLLEDANNRISDLVEDCEQEHLSNNIQLVIFQVVSSIRSVLAAANSVSKDSPLLKTYPELARQRKNALSSLSRLVLKGKELQALCQVGDENDNDNDGSRRTVQHDIPNLANQLLMDLGLFERVLRSIILSFPVHNSDSEYGNDYDGYSNDESDSSTQGDDYYSSNNNLAVALKEKNHTHGTLDSIELAHGFRQHILANPSSSSDSSLTKAVSFSDAYHIIRTILDHQTCIDEIVAALMITVEEYLSAPQRATHMLEMTRKAVEAVRTFLAMVEHVCSNVGDSDYKQRSVIPDNPHLVALVLAKESVYSAITNLVTAVRALTGPKDQHTDNYDDLCHLQSCCQHVTHSTNDCASCVRACLCVDDSPLDQHITPPTTASLLEMRDKLENSLDVRQNQTLSILGRKVTSLNALQRQYSSNESDNDNDDSHGIASKKSSVSNITTDRACRIDSGIAAGSEDSTRTTAANQTNGHHVEKSDMQQHQLAASSSEPSTSAPISVIHDVMNGYRRHRTHSIPSVLSENSQSRSSLGGRSTRSNQNRVSRSHAVPAQRRSQAATTQTSLTTRSSVISNINSTSGPSSDRSSVDSFNMTPLTTPEAMSPVTKYDDDIPLGKQMIAKLDLTQRQARPRSSSINALAIVPTSSQQAPLASTQRIPLPPIPPSPMDPPSDPQPTSSKSTPTSDMSVPAAAAATTATTATTTTTTTTTKTRRPRGMSVNALRMSIKQRYDDRSANGTSSKEVTGTKSINRISSFSSIRSTDQNSFHEATAETDPWFIKQRSFTEDEIIVNAEGQLTGASIEALVEKLTSHDKSPDLLFTRAFFYCFRLFTTPSVFINLLIQRFQLLPPSNPVLSEDDLALWQNRVLVPVRLRVYNVIKTWLENYYRSEQDDVESQLMTFTTGDMREAMPGPAKRMTELIQKTFENRSQLPAHRKMSYALHSAPHPSTNSAANGSHTPLNDHNPARPPLNTKNSSGHLSLSSGSSLFSELSLFGNDNHNSHNLSNSEQISYPPINLTRSLRNTLRKAVNQDNLALVHINDFDCMELARQFTLMESALFCQITPYELIGQEFKKKVGQSTAIHIKAMIQTSTHVTSWVSDSILREQDAKRRAQMLKFWIKVGDCCLQMNNYNTLMAIRSALDSTSIRRLKKSWDILSSKYKSLLEPIYRATDSARNFAEYRMRLKMAVAPCLPFLGVYLTDMTFIDDGNSNHRTTSSGRTLINFDKYIKTTKVLNEIDQFQVPYKLLEVEEIQRYLSRCLETVVKDEQLFYDRSVALEPRQEEPTASDIRHTISQFT